MWDSLLFWGATSIDECSERGIGRASHAALYRHLYLPTGSNIFHFIHVVPLATKGPSRNELREQTLLSSKCPSHWVPSKVIILHPPTMVPVLTQLPAISLRARNERHVDYSEVLVLRSLRGTTILSRRAAGRLATHATTTSAEVSHPIGWDAICVDRVDPRVDILGNLHLQR